MQLKTSDESPIRLSMPLDLARDHTLGPPTAPVQLLEYGDYECPDCGRAYPLLHELQKRFEGKLLFAFRHFPQYTIHAHASVAAQAAEAAASQGKFWAMHDQLYLHQNQLRVPDLSHHALRAGLEIYKFNSAVDSGIYLKRVQDDFASGLASGVKGTPTLFINGGKYPGPVEFEPLATAIEAAMTTK